MRAHTHTHAWPSETDCVYVGISVFKIYYRTVVDRTAACLPA